MSMVAGRGRLLWWALVNSTIHSMQSADGDYEHVFLFPSFRLLADVAVLT